MRKQKNNESREVELKSKFDNEGINKSINNNINDVSDNSDSKSNSVTLTRKSRYLIFAVFSAINICINLDNGFIPAASDEIKSYLNINEAIFGLYGSLAFFGCLLGSFMSMPLLQMKNRKITFIVSIIINIGSTLGLAIKDKYWSSIMRVFNGISQAFVTIYSPLWVDQYGSRTSKSLMMAIQQISGPLGVVLGYILTVGAKKMGSWYYSLFFQCSVETISIIIVFFISSEYFRNDVFCKAHAALKTESSSIKEKEDEVDLENMNKSSYVKSNSDNQSKLENEDRNIKSIYNNNNINDNENDNNNNDLNRNSVVRNDVKYHSPMKNKLQKPFAKSSSKNKNGSFQYTDNNLKNPNGEISGIKLDIINDNSNNLNLNIKQINENDISNKDNENNLVDDYDENPYSDQKLNERKKHKRGQDNENCDDYSNNKDNHNENPNNIENENVYNNKVKFQRKSSDCEGEKGIESNDNESDKENKKKAEDDDISVFEYIETPAGSSVKEKLKEYCTNMKKLGPNKVYIFSLVTVCIFNFISFAIQYWVSDHLKQVMHFDEDSITVSFIVTCVTAPVSGVILGGYIVGKLGGYARKKAVLFCLISALLAAVDSVLIVFQETLIGFSVVLWFFLFFGGATIPNMLGILISSVPNDMKSFGNSLANTCISSLGQLPAPYVYGAILNIDKKSKRAFNFTMLFSWFGILFIGLTALFRYKQPDKVSNKESKEEKAEKNSISEKSLSRHPQSRDEKRFSQPRQNKKLHYALEESQINPKNKAESVIYDRENSDKNIYPDCNEQSFNNLGEKSSRIKFTKLNNKGNTMKERTSTVQNMMQKDKDSEFNVDREFQINKEYNINIKSGSANRDIILDSKSIKKDKSSKKIEREDSNLEEIIMSDKKKSNKSELYSKSFNSEAVYELEDNLDKDPKEHFASQSNMDLGNQILNNNKIFNQDDFNFEDNPDYIDKKFMTGKNNVHIDFDGVNIAKFTSQKNLNKLQNN